MTSLEASGPLRPLRPARLLSGLAVAGVLALTAACGSSDSSGSSSASDASGSSPSAATSPTPSQTAASGTCTYSEDGSPAAKKVALPPAEPTATGQKQVTITTDQGAVPVTLTGQQTPCTVNSFLSLAKQGFFDKTPCHRLTTAGIYVLQCGDPTGTGSGGPGYSFADELTGSETYGPGTLAMANAGADTNGSQFFLVYQDSPLPPSYTVFGRMNAAGLKVVQAVAAKGSNNQNGQGDGAPNQAVTIESVK